MIGLRGLELQAERALQAGRMSQTQTITKQQRLAALVRHLGTAVPKRVPTGYVRSPGAREHLLSVAVMQAQGLLNTSGMKNVGRLYASGADPDKH